MLNTIEFLVILTQLRQRPQDLITDPENWNSFKQEFRSGRTRSMCAHIALFVLGNWLPAVKVRSHLIHHHSCLCIYSDVMLLLQPQATLSQASPETIAVV